MADASQWKNADVGRCRFTTDINKPVVVASESSNQPTSTAATTTAVATTTTVAPAPLALGKAVNFLALKNLLTLRKPLIPNELCKNLAINKVQSA